jgi:host factor-I protein
MNLQDLFLNQVRKENVPVTIYLVSGVQLKGLVKGFDSFTLILETPGKPAQLVYKHAMASVVPARPLGGLIGRDEQQYEDRSGAREEDPQ